MEMLLMRPLLPLFAAWLLASCGGIARVELSKPYDSHLAAQSELHPECRAISRSADIARLPLEGDLELEVAACDWELRGITVGPAILPILPWLPGILSAFAQAPARPLWIELSLPPRTSLRLDAMSASVQLGEETFPATRFYATRQTACGWRPYDEPGSARGLLDLGLEPLAVEGPISIALLFEVPASAPGAFALELRGLRSEETLLDTLVIQFRGAVDWLFCAGA
jgi:hypothetical protein